MLRLLIIVSESLQASTKGKAARNFELRSLSIGNGGSLESLAMLSTVVPALKMNVTSFVNILPGGKIAANWIDITTKSLSVDGSGEISAANAGFLEGPGAGTGKLGFMLIFHRM